MSSCTDTRKLYMKLSFDKTPSTCSVDKDDDDYIATVTVNRELFSELDDGDGHLDEAFTAIADALECDELLEVGTVEEEGWYEPPHYNYADPAAACDADGETTSATVSVDCTEEQFADALTASLDAQEKPDNITQEEYEVVMAIARKVAEKLPSIVIAELDKFDGEDVL